MSCFAQKLVLYESLAQLLVLFPDIKEGEELTYNYDIYDTDWELFDLL